MMRSGVSVTLSTLSAVKRVTDDRETQPLTAAARWYPQGWSDLS